MLTQEQIFDTIKSQYEQKKKKYPSLNAPKANVKKERSPYKIPTA